jgi:Mrp family chromosome partitioning ATPase
LLVDAHLRDHDDAEVNEGAGLAEILRGEQEPETVNPPQPSAGVYVLHRGRSMKRSLNLLRDDILDAAIRKLKKRFDWVVLDAPPVTRYPETPVLARHCDGVILVVEAERTRTAVAKRAKALIENGGSEVVGVVLNRRRYPIPGLLYEML